MAQVRPHGLKRYFDQALIPTAVDAAAWCEEKAFKTEQAVEQAPLASVIVAMLVGVALGWWLLPRRPSHPDRRGGWQGGTGRSASRSQ